MEQLERFQPLGEPLPKVLVQRVLICLPGGVSFRPYVSGVQSQLEAVRLLLRTLGNVCAQPIDRRRGTQLRQHAHSKAMDGLRTTSEPAISLETRPGVGLLLLQPCLRPRNSMIAGVWASVNSPSRRMGQKKGGTPIPSSTAEATSPAGSVRHTCVSHNAPGSSTAASGASTTARDGSGRSCLTADLILDPRVGKKRENRLETAGEAGPVEQLVHHTEELNGVGQDVLQSS